MRFEQPESGACVPAVSACAADVSPCSLLPEEARRWARTGVLAALALVLSYVETFIPLPLPVPGAKLGLANIPVLMALKTVDAKSALAIAVIKTLIVGFLFGSPLMIPYSAAGTLLAFLAMRLLVSVRGLSLVFVSVAGSVCHIAGQLVVASLMLGTMLVWYTFPLLFVVACVTGVLTGKATAFLLESLEASSEEEACADGAESGRAACARAAGPASEPEEAAFASASRSSLGLGTKGRSAACAFAARIDARVLLLALFAYTVFVFCAPNAIALGACALVALCLAVAARIGVRDALRALVPLLSILVITAIAQVLYVQSGEVLVCVGGVAVTTGALRTVAFMLARLVCVMTASVAFARLVPLGSLRDALSRLLEPLARFGVCADAFVLAFDLAFRFIPVLMSEFERLRAAAQAADPAFGEGNVVYKLRGYATLFAPLARSSFRYADTAAAAFSSGER